jgi:hypothetical protein
VYRSIDQDGKIEINAYKSLDEYKNHIFDKVEIQIHLNSTKKAPAIKAAVKEYVDNSTAREIVTFVEVPDGKGRTSNSLAKDVFIEKHYRESSILSVKELFDELMPKFDEIIARYKGSK